MCDKNETEIIRYFYVPYNYSVGNYSGMGYGYVRATSSSPDDEPYFSITNFIEVMKPVIRNKPGGTGDIHVIPLSWMEINKAQYDELAAKNEAT